MSAARHRRGAWMLTALLLGYLGALVLWRDSIPPGLNNDAAEEALRGIELLDAGRWQVLSDSPGIPQETLYLYLVAALSRVVGTTTLAIQLGSWVVAIACIWLSALAARRAEPGVPVWAAPLLAVGSPWLFHYGRAGVRAISAPFFALVVALLLDRAERQPARRGAAIACGAALGASLYAYTACRVLVVVFLLHAAIRVWRARVPRRPLLACYGTIVAALVLVSIPNLLYAAAAPAAFLWRGGYVVRGGWSDVLGHLAASLLVPFTYPERYRVLAGTAHIFDGVTAGLTGAGIAPVSLLAAGTFALGLIPAWRRRERPIVLFLLLLWGVATLLLGFTGPSLTRLLIELPAFIVVGALGIAAVVDRWSRARPLMVALLLAGAALAAHDYFVTFAGSDAARAYFSPAATPIGIRANALAEAGQQVLCIVGKDANVVRYLTHDRAAQVDVLEVYHRPFDRRDLSPVFQTDIVLIERAPALAGAAAAFRVRNLARFDAFDELELAR